MSFLIRKQFYFLEFQLINYFYDSAQNKRSAFFTKTRIGIKHETLEKRPEMKSLTYSDYVFSHLKNERV